MPSYVMSISGIWVSVRIRELCGFMDPTLSSFVNTDWKLWFIISATSYLLSVTFPFVFLMLSIFPLDFEFLFTKFQNFLGLAFICLSRILLKKLYFASFISTLNFLQCILYVRRVVSLLVLF